VDGPNETRLTAMIAANPHNAMKARLTNPKVRNHGTAHTGPNRAHDPLSQLGFHSSR
jgi:hypothetical protein